MAAILFRPWGCQPGSFLWSIPVFPFHDQDCNVLAFILDHLLAQCQTSGDKDCPPLARVLLASLASCTHSPEAQGCLATELKGALQRAMALPENTDKHSRLQALTSMISTVIDACPTPGQVPNQVQSLHRYEMKWFQMKLCFVADASDLKYLKICYSKDICDNVLGKSKWSSLL